MSQPPLRRGRAALHPIHAMLWVAVALSSSGCITPGTLAPLEDWVVPIAWPDPEYDEFYDHYVELCAVSQYRPKNGEDGGIPGHGVMYLKGACLDLSRDYPRLVRCPEVSRDELDPWHGTGISVNRWFSNVNWVGIPGKHLFYNGNVKPWEVLDQEASDAAVANALELGLFDGVEYGEYPTSQERSRENFVATQSLGTDFGLRFGRSLFCSRLPVEAAQLDATIEFLNEQNRQYAEDDVSYSWSGYADNCVHLVHNALAAAKIWKPVSVRQTKLKQLFNLAVPANEFIDLGYRSLALPVEDFRKVWLDQAQREALLEYDWLPTRHGAMVMTAPPHARNELFDAKMRLFVLQGPFGSSATKKANVLMTDARATDLEANLRFFKQRYEAILDDRTTEEDEIFPNLPGFDASRRRYYDYVERQLAEVDAHLAVVLARSEQSFGPRYRRAAPRPLPDDGLPPSMGTNEDAGSQGGAP